MAVISAMRCVVYTTTQRSLSLRMTSKRTSASPSGMAEVGSSRSRIRAPHVVVLTISTSCITATDSRRIQMRGSMSMPKTPSISRDCAIIR